MPESFLSYNNPLNEDHKRELATRAELENGLLAIKADRKADREKREPRLRHDLTLRLDDLMTAPIAMDAALVKP